MSTSDITQAATAFIDQVWNSSDGVERLERWLSADYRDHAYEQDREGLERALTELRTAFPDAAFEIEDIISDRGCAVLRMTLRGTHTCAFRDRAPTGAQIQVKVFRWLRFHEGRVAEHWALLDTASLLRQLAS